MDKALVYGTRDSGFDPQYGRLPRPRYFFSSDLDQSSYLGSKSFESVIEITKYGLGKFVLLRPSFMFDCNFCDFYFPLVFFN